MRPKTHTTLAAAGRVFLTQADEGAQRPELDDHRGQNEEGKSTVFHRSFIKASFLGLGKDLMAASRFSAAERPLQVSR